MDTRKQFILDVVAGGVVGGVVSAIAAVNFVIYTGVEGGYEATIPEVFRHNVLIGIATVIILIAGPVAGAWIARRQRRRTTQSRGTADAQEDRKVNARG